MADVQDGMTKRLLGDGGDDTNGQIGSRTVLARRMACQGSGRPTPRKSHFRESFVPQRLLWPLVAALCAISLPGIARGQAAPGASPVVKATLPGGIRVVCRRENTPLVALDVFVRTGVAQETAATAGLSNFVARTVLASRSDTTPEQMQEDIGALGGNVSTTWQPEWTQINALTVRDQFKDAAFLLTEVLKHADFDADTVEDTRRQILSDVDGRDADLFQTAYGGLRRALYPSSGYALPSAGTLQSVRRLTRADLVDFYDRYYIPRNFVVVVIGDVDPQDAIATLKGDLDDFPEGRTGRRGDLTPDAPPLPTQDTIPVRVYQPDLAESAVMVGYRVPPATSPDYPALLVANTLLGGMKTSRLFTNLREKQGLAYELGSVYSPQLVASDIAAYVFAPPLRTDPTTKKPVPTVGLVKEQILRQFESFQTTPPTPAELARAQHFLIGSYKIKHERIEDRAYYLGFAEMARGDTAFDTDYAKYINAVTAADVQRVATSYFVHPGISTIEPDATVQSSEAPGPP